MLKSIFAEPIYQVNDIISEEENQKLIDECYRLQAITESGHSSWDCDIYTTHGSGDSLIFNSVFDEFHRTMKKHVDAYCEETKAGYSVNCGYSWFNIASMGHYQEQHLHPGYRISAVYYARSPVGSSGTKFKSPYDNQLGDMYGGDSPFGKVHMTSPVERSLLIFPSHLPHWVPLGTNMEDRITLASNWE